MGAIKQIIAAMLGTFGFCMMFNVHLRHIIIPTIGGGLCWALFVLMREIIGVSIFLATVISAAVVGIYGLVFSHTLSISNMVLFIPSCIPLVPGSNLYYAFSGLLSRNWNEFHENAVLLVIYAVGIAIGLGTVSELKHIIIRLVSRMKFRV